MTIPTPLPPIDQMHYGCPLRASRPTVPIHPSLQDVDGRRAGTTKKSREITAAKGESVLTPCNINCHSSSPELWSDGTEGLGDKAHDAESDRGNVETRGNGTSAYSGGGNG